MKSRLSALLKEKNLSAGKFAEVMEVQPSSISHLISGRNKPNFDFLVKLLDHFPDVNPDWFISGRGEMFRKATPGNSVSEKNVSLPLFGEQAVASSGYDNPGGLFADTERKRKTIDKIVVFYSDHTFSAYTSENDITKE